MNRRPFTLLLPILLLLTFSDPALAQRKALTLEQAMGGGERVRFSGRAPSWKWASDGTSLIGPDGKWIDPATAEEVRQPEAKDADEGTGTQRKAILEALAELDDVDEKLARRISARRRGQSDDGEVQLYLHDGRAWIVRQATGARELDLPEGLAHPELSADGSWISYVLEHDIYASSTAKDDTRRLTTDGSETQLNGVLDWVYQEEVYGRGRFNAYWWSSDSRHIAFLSFDESKVHEFTVIDHIEDGHFRVKPEITHYPKVGDPNPTVRFGIADVHEKKTVWADLSRYEEEEPLVVRVTWVPGGELVLFTVQDRAQKWADLNVCDPRTGEWQTLIHEENDSWVTRPSAPLWLEDGTFLWYSNRTDYRHLYHYRMDGELIGAVTAGDWSFGRIIELDEEQQLLWFSSTKDGAVNGNVYRVGLDGEGLVRLTRGEGRHSLSFNDDRSFFIDSYSSLSIPPSVRLCGGDGEIVRELSVAKIPDRETYLTSDWELHEIPARDGYRLDIALLKPVPFDASKPHPVWISTYSGPNAPSVRNRYNGSVWSQFLAQQGFVQFQVNVRSASGKGHWATEQCYGRLGVQELADFEDALDWLTIFPWVDAARVGITGHSYGGFMAAFALTHSDRFALGIAGSGVYDWRMYDTIYTERYMNLLRDNPEGYAAASVIDAAKDLSGHLLITHGTMDDNVHLQNAMQLVYALQKAGKMNFEMMFYPQSRHGIGHAALRRHSRLLEWGAMKEHLLDR
jgi:dipeptidyl-peptidase 4